MPKKKSKRIVYVQSTPHIVQLNMSEGSVVLQTPDNDMFTLRKMLSIARKELRSKSKGGFLDRITG